MERIGIAASRMAKGKLFWYNFYVVLIAALFSLFVFLITAATVVFSLIIIRYVGDEIMTVSLFRDFSVIVMVCMLGLSIVMGIFMLIAVSKNFKINKVKE